MWSFFLNLGNFCQTPDTYLGIEVDGIEVVACDRLEARHPDAQIWVVRVGSDHVRRFGGRSRRRA